MPTMDIMPPFDLLETALEAPCGPLSVAFEFGIYTTFFLFLENYVKSEYPHICILFSLVVVVVLV